MQKYFYADGENSNGPFSLDELKSKGITPNTKVWCEGMADWLPASQVPDLKDLLRLSPPPLGTESRAEYRNDNYLKNNNYNKNKMENSTQQPPKTWLVESILATLFCCLPLGIVGIVNASKVESRFYAGDVNAAQQASAEAKKWTMISFILGLVGIVLYIILLAAGVAVGL